MQDVVFLRAINGEHARTYIHMRCLAADDGLMGHLT